jgi:hypothetical protein
MNDGRRTGEEKTFTTKDTKDTKGRSSPQRVKGHQEAKANIRPDARAAARFWTRCACQNDGGKERGAMRIASNVFRRQSCNSAFSIPASWICVLAPS